MAKEPKAVYLLSEDSFTEITHAEFSERYLPDKEYMDTHFFIRLGEYMMEVTREDYLEHYKARRRQKYICECAEENGDVSFDALTNAEFNGEDVLLDRSEDVADQIELAIMTDKLKKAMLTLTDKEQLLIYQYYYSGVSEPELSKLYGITQQAISKRIHKIHGKLKKLLEI